MQKWYIKQHKEANLFKDDKLTKQSNVTAVVNAKAIN